MAIVARGQAEPAVRPSSWSARRVAVAMILGLLTCAALQLRADYLTAINNAETLSGAVAQAIDQHLGGSIRSIDSLLDEVASAVEGRRADTPQFAIHIQTRLAAFPELRYVGVVNAQGRMQSRTWPDIGVPAEGLEVSDRDYFIRQLNAIGPPRLVVGTPVMGRISGERTVHLSRPLRGSDGRFMGVVVAAVNTDRYANFLSTMLLDPDGASAMIGLDGRLLARAPNYQETFGRDISDSDLLRIWVRRAPVSVAHLVARTDGNEKLLAYRVLDGYPLLVSAGISKKKALGSWRQMVWAEGILLLAISAALFYWARLADLRSSSLLSERAKLEATVVERTSSLMASERRLSQILAGTSDGFWDWDLIGGGRYLSPRWFAMFAIDVALTDDPAKAVEVWLSRIHVQDRDAVLAALDHCEAGRHDRFNVEYRYRPNPASRWQWILSRGTLTRGEDGTPLRLTGADTDISDRKGAETQLRAASGRLKLVLETVAEGIVGLDDESRVVFANPAAARILGWSSAEAMQGGKSSDILGHVLSDGSLCVGSGCAIRQTLEDGEVRRVTNESFRGASGVLKPVEYVVSPLVVEDIVVGAALIFHDVTERRLAEIEITRLTEFRRAILDAAGNAIIATDTHGVITLFNATAEKWLGYTGPDMVGQQTPAILHDPEEVAARASELSQRLGRPLEGDFAPLVAVTESTGQTDVQEWTMVARNGTRIPVLLSTSALRDDLGQITGYLGVAQDISSIKGLEQDLKRSNAELERFAYVASHDLREPLRMISSYITMLDRRLKDRLGDEEREFIGYAVDGARRMDRMIIDLLDYSRIGRSSAVVAPVDLGEAVKGALVNLQRASGSAEIHVAEGLPTVCGSLSALERLFQNLIGNALKFQAPDQTPMVWIDWRDGQTEWVLSVKDNGIGIDPKDHDRLFAIFQRLVPRSQYEGTGIGLAACRKIMEHHGGRIWLESALGQGCTFFMAFPKQGKGENCKGVA